MSSLLMIVLVALAVVIGIAVVAVILVFALRSMRPKAPEAVTYQAPPTTAMPVMPSAGDIERTATRARPLSQEATAEIDRLIAGDQTIQAIKLYREQTGLGLAEAKRAVESWQIGSAPSTMPIAPASASSVRASVPASVASEIDQLVAADKKIAAIKVLRDSSGLGLAESKHAIDHWN